MFKKIEKNRVLRSRKPLFVDPEEVKRVMQRDQLEALNTYDQVM